MLNYASVVFVRVLEHKYRKISDSGSIPLDSVATQGLNKTLNDMTTEIADWKSKRAAAQYARSTDDNRFLSLQGDNRSLIDLLVAEKLTQANMTIVVNELGHQVRVAEQETRDAEALANEDWIIRISARALTTTLHNCFWFPVKEHLTQHEPKLLPFLYSIH